MPPNLPGFYWDPEKNRYFKIQASQTAPPNAEWSTTAVKRRKTEAEAVKKVRRRKHQIKKNIKRSPIHDFWTFSGPLTSEVEGKWKVREGDVRCMAWASGLEKKGSVVFGENRGDGVNLGAFCVRNGAMYASADESRVQFVGTQTDNNGCLRAMRHDIGDDGILLSVFPIGAHITGDISSIKSDAEDKRLLVTSRSADGYPTVYMIHTDEDGDLHDYSAMAMVERGNFARGRPQDSWWVNTCAVTPPSHRLSSTALGYLGTSMGPVAIPGEYRYPAATTSVRVLTDHETNKIRSEVFTMDFQPGQGSSLIFGGGRGPKIWSMNDRSSWIGKRSVYVEDPGTITHGSPVASVRFVNEHQLLAAGPRSKMALYDIRFTRNEANNYVSKPLLEFPTYRNEARFDLGIDVSPDGHTVVAAQEDGGVKVFSIGSGSEVSCPALADIGGGGGGVRKVYFGDGGDLYLGIGGSVAKFGFGTNRIGDV